MTGGNRNVGYPKNGKRELIPVAASNASIKVINDTTGGGANDIGVSLSVPRSGVEQHQLTLSGHWELRIELDPSNDSPTIRMDSKIFKYWKYKNTEILIVNLHVPYFDFNYLLLFNVSLACTPLNLFYCIIVNAD